MNCIICNGPVGFYFSRHFGQYGLEDVEYWRCEECGFTFSKTHAEMDGQAWQQVNRRFHEEFFGSALNKLDLRWVSRLNRQAELLADATDIGLLPRTGKWLDYGCGDGKLSELMKKNHGLTLLKYDEYLPASPDCLAGDDLKPGGFDFVITTSLFEHITTREHLDRVHSLVSPEGAMGLHTLVRKEIPKDPDWFYLHPVHCAFFTNESMRILLLQWGYSCSVYNVDATLWLFFKIHPERVEKIVAEANRRARKPTYLFKNEFVDYWP